LVALWGGGIYNTGTLTVINSTVSGNSGFCHGCYLGRCCGENGGISNSGILTMTNSTVSGNSPAPDIYNEGTVTLTNSTVSGVPQPQIENKGLLQSTGTVIHGACSGGQEGTWVSKGYNVESPGETCGFDQPTDRMSVSPYDLNLGPLARYGGQTETIPLLGGSAAVDWIPNSACVDADEEPLTTDQRGITRPQGLACDVGAFERADCSGSICDDGIECTDDLCDPPSYEWCANVPVLDGTACDFGGDAGFCIAGACVEQRWESSVPIGTDGVGGTPHPQVAVDPNGNATVVWEQSDGTLYNIWSNRYTSSEGWGAAVLIETNMSSASEPQVAVDPNGNVTAVWSQDDGGGLFSIWSNRYTPGEGWGTAVVVETSMSNASEPQVAVDPNGNVTAVWSQNDSGELFSIWSNRYTPGEGWGTAVLIETNDAGGASEPQVAVDPNGNATVVWSQNDGPFYDPSIWSNRYTPGEGWGTAVLIETINDNARFPQVAVGASGIATTVWEQGDSIWSNHYTPSIGWGAAVPISSAEHSAAFPQVAVDSDGNATAVWFGLSDGVEKVWSNRYTPSTGWGTPVLIQIDDRQDAMFPTVAVDLNGNATAVWMQFDGNLINIWSNRYMPSTGWGTAVLVETDNAGHSWNPQVAVDPNGNATVVWVQCDSSDCVLYNIWSSRSK
jgi:hypothetical protein